MKSSLTHNWFGFSAILQLGQNTCVTSIAQHCFQHFFRSSFLFGTRLVRLYLIVTSNIPVSLSVDITDQWYQVKPVWQSYRFLSGRWSRLLLGPHPYWYPANTKHICITFVQCRSNVEDVGSTLYKYYTKCLLGTRCIVRKRTAVTTHFTSNQLQLFAPALHKIVHRRTVVTVYF